VCFHAPVINLTKLVLALNVLVLAFWGGLRFHFWQIAALSDKLLARVSQ
jgi:hypothetical protein